MSSSDIRKVFSSSDDSDDYSSSSIKKILPKTSLKIPELNHIVSEDIDLSKYKLVESNQYSIIPKNSRILYIKMSGKKTQNKYFKRVDPITNSILLGFYQNDRRNYSEKISNLKELYVDIGASGQIAEDPLKDTIELKSDQWKTLRRDTIISYQKKDNEWVYSAKFNAFVKSSKDQSSRMSMTSERGFSFVANPININKIYRHISGNDKTLTFILQSFKQLDQRVGSIEKKIKYLDNRLKSIENKFNAVR
jgi:hypothetical protein